MTKEQASQVIDAAGIAGGVDEVKRIANDGWPAHCGDTVYSDEDRDLIQQAAKHALEDG